MKILTIIIACVLYLSSCVHASTALQITDIGISADSVGIANIHGFSHSPSSVFANPSNLYEVDGRSFSYFNATLNQAMVNYHNLAYSQHIDETSGFVIGVMQLQTDPHSATAMDEFNEVMEVSSFSYTNSLLKAAYYQKWNSIAYSIGLTYSHTEFFDLNANGLNADIGILLVPKNKRGLSTAITVRNIIPGLKMTYSDGTSESIPMQAFFSFKQPISHFEIYGQVQYEKGKEEMLKALGISYRVMDSLRLNAGQREYFALQKVESTLVYGVSIDVLNLGIHYAMEPYSFAEGETKNFLSINFNF